MVPRSRDPLPPFAETGSRSGGPFNTVYAELSCMNLTESLIEDKAREYTRREPLFSIEQDNIDTLPAAFADGSFTWKDAEWVVWWYYRRFLGEYPHDRRRAVEDAFAGNDFGTVRDVIETVRSANDPPTRVRQLTTLDGVDVPIASAFLLFMYPERYIVVGEREWGVLHDAGELGVYPDSPSVGEYGTYLETARTVADRFGLGLWTLYRGLWRLAKR